MCNKFKKAFGQNLRKIRQETSYTQEKLALESGISRSHIAMIEAGKRDITLTNLFKISRALGISLSELFEFDDTEMFQFDIEELYK